ncbi:DNA primase [Streptomyces sp. NPDC091217]|uniref:DNA primase n=1 Tax=Streptomyces sp. NPDC091217 TaxID=3365975 RepID=UPI003803D82B
MNRIGLGLAIGAGYLLGRTRKLKLAFAVGSLMAGKRLNLSPKAVMDLANQQLRDNPQFKEIGNQLREDLRGVGKAASGAMVERQLDAFADRLHDRTAEVRDELAGVVPDTGDLAPGDDRDDEEPEGEAGRAEGDRDKRPARRAEGDRDERPARKTSGRKAAPNQAAKKPPAKKAAGKKPPAKKAAQSRSAARRTAGHARSKGGGDR